MLRDFPGLREESGDLISHVYFRLDSALRDPSLVDRARTVADVLGLINLQLRRVLHDLVRRLKEHEGLPNDSQMAPDTANSGVSKEIIVVEQREAILAALPKLSERSRMMIELLDIAGRTNVEVSQRFGVDEATIRRWLDKAHIELARLLGPGHNPVQE